MASMTRNRLAPFLLLAVILTTAVFGSDWDEQNSESAIVERVYQDDDGGAATEALRQVAALPASGKILIVVNSSIYGSILDSLTMYKKDLQREGYTVEVYSWSGGTQATFRAFLKTNRTNLVGAVLVGSLPIPWTEDVFIYGSDLDSIATDSYYNELDSAWYDTDNDGLLDSTQVASPIRDVDLWIGRLDPGNCDSLDAIASLKNYFSRNHQYRLGNVVRASRSLRYINIRYTSCSGSPTFDAWAEVYDENACIDSGTAGGNSKATYLNKIKTDLEALITVAHGSSCSGSGHTFEQTGYECVSFWDIQNAYSRPLFVHNGSCAGTDWTRRNTLSKSYIFGKASGLAVAGQTISIGLLQGLFEHMGGRKTLGEAYKIAYSEEGLGQLPLALLGDPTLRLRKTWNLNAAGTGDAPTIQAAIDSAAYYDRIVLASGVYTGVGNRNISFKGKPVVLTREFDTSTVIIDCQYAARGFLFNSGETAGSKIIGLRITRGYAPADGGAIMCVYGTSPEIIDCFIDSCSLTGPGYAVAFRDSCKALIKGCTIINCGGGVSLWNTCTSKVQNSLVAYNLLGGIYYGGTNSSLVSCSDVFGNTGDGNYSGSKSFSGLNGNISANPLFCNAAAGNYSVDMASPCVAANNSCYKWIGSTRKGCSSRLCGDANGDGYVDISDVVFITAYIFSGGSAPNPLSSADVDCNGYVDISDVVYLNNYIFSGGAVPCAACL